MQKSLAYSSLKKWRRTDAYLRRRQRFLSGKGKEARELHPGDVVNIPANEKHWHGAAADSWFSHLAIEIEGEDTSNEWCESVTDEDYLKIQ